jgi:hypothetical protein
MKFTLLEFRDLMFFGAAKAHQQSFGGAAKTRHQITSCVVSVKH